MSTATRTATALEGRIGVPHDVRVLLSGIELEAERLRDRLLQDDPRWEPVIERDRLFAIAALASFLDDRARGGLPRALRRIDAIQRDESVRLALDRAWRRVSGIAARLLQRRDALADYRASFIGLTKRSVLGWHVADCVARWHFEPSQVATLSAPLIGARQAHFEREMERLDARWRALPKPAGSSVTWPLQGAISFEDVAVARSALPASAFAPTSLDRRRLLRRLSDAQLAAWIGEHVDSQNDAAADEALCDAPVGWPLPLAREVLRRCTEGHGTGSDDLDARSLLILEAAKRIPWASGSVPVVDDAFPDRSETAPFLRPLFGDYVLIQGSIPAPVRLVQSVFHAGMVVEATLHGIRSVSLPFATWGGGIFTEPDLAASSAWAVLQRPKVAVVAQVDAEAWLGRVTRRGHLKPSGTEGPEVITMRNASCFLDDVVRLRAKLKVVQTRRFGGLVVRDVEVPVEDHRMAELHTASDTVKTGPLEAEHLFLRRAATRLQGVVPRPVGRASDGEGFLYAPLVAKKVSHSVVVERIRQESPLLLAGSIARLWGRLTSDEVKLALGLYHLDAMAFRCVPDVREHPGSRWARLDCIVSSAPCGCPLGSPYPRFDDLDATRFARLGRISLVRALASMETASVVSEARMVLLCIADLLTRRVIRVPDGDVRSQCEGIIVRARGEPEAFHDAELVVRVMHAYTGTDGDVLAAVRSFERE